MFIQINLKRNKWTFIPPAVELSRDQEQDPKQPTWNAGKSEEGVVKKVEYSHMILKYARQAKSFGREMQPEDPDEIASEINLNK